MPCCTARLRIAPASARWTMTLQISEVTGQQLKYSDTAEITGAAAGVATRPPPRQSVESLICCSSNSGSLPSKPANGTSLRQLGQSRRTSLCASTPSSDDESK